VTGGLTAEEFYRLRDDRTNRLTPSRDFHRLRVRLAAGTPTVHTACGQMQLLVAANLLARWCRSVEFAFPDAPLPAPLQAEGHATLHRRVLAEVREADPFGRFSFDPDSAGAAQYTLRVGGGPIPGLTDFSILAEGWVVRAGQGDLALLSNGPETNPAVAAFAACVGVADAFKVATGQPAESRVREAVIDLLTLRLGAPLDGGVPAPPVPVILGKTQIVGLGSVGSAVVYLLMMLTFSGRILLIDHDILKVENLNRSPLFGTTDLGRKKVHVAAGHLAHRVPVEAFEGRYDEFVASAGRKPGDMDLLLPLANEFGVRPIIENNYPPLQIYGTTTPDWGINYHRHIPLREDCSVCRFPPTVEEQQGVFRCSEGEVETEAGEHVDAAFPFLSMGAASLVVADLIRLQMPGYPLTPNFAFLDLKGPLEFILTNPKRPKTGCLCAGRSKAIHESYAATTRFEALSRTRCASR
jgi:hypothetical protein